MPPHDGVPNRYLVPIVCLRRFVPVRELAEALKGQAHVDSAAWRADLMAADDGFGSDDPADPFDESR